MNDEAENVRDGFDSLVIYTAISEGYDFLRPVPPALADLKCICFMDEVSSPYVKNGWEIRPFPKPDLDRVRRCREVKLRPHVYFPDYQYSLWIDANIEVQSEVRSLLAGLMMQVNYFYTFPHPFRDCIYEEARACCDDGKDDPSVIADWLARIRAEGYPKNNGLVESNVIFRQHNDHKVRSVGEAWWECVRDATRRDQLSFNYVAWKLGFSYGVLNGSSRGDKSAFVVKDHSRGFWLKNLYLSLDAKQGRGGFYVASASLIRSLLLVLSGLRSGFRRKRNQKGNGGT